MVEGHHGDKDICVVGDRNSRLVSPFSGAGSAFHRLAAFDEGSIVGFQGHFQAGQADLVAGIDQDRIADAALVFEQVQRLDHRLFQIVLHGHRIDGHLPRLGDRLVNGAQGRIVLRKLAKGSRFLEADALGDLGLAGRGGDNRFFRYDRPAAVLPEHQLSNGAPVVINGRIQSCFCHDIILLLFFL